MPSNANVLSLFSPQPPVEPTAPKADRGSDSDFKDFLNSASRQAEPTQKPNPGDSAQDNRRDKIRNAEKLKTRLKSGKDKTETDDTKYAETASKESVSEKNAAFTEKLKELGLKQEELEALLEYLGLNGDLSFESFLQSLTQNLNQNGIASGEDIESLSESELIARLQKREGETINLLKKAGLTDAQAKNLVNHIKTPSTISAQKEADKNLELNIKKDIQAQQAQFTEKESTKQAEQSELSKRSGQQEKGNAAAAYAQAKEVSQKAGKKDRAASLDKLPETPKTEEAPRITLTEPAGKQGTKTSNSFSQLLNDNKAQANLVQIEDRKNAGSFKGPESAKSAPDIQLQSPASAAENAVKVAAANKPALPEKLVARGASETKIINQIVNKLSANTTGAKNEVHVKLDPPSLGTVRLNISTVGDSVRTVIIAENHAVKQTIENNFGQLRDAMNDQGLKVDSFSVTVGGESGSANQNGKPLGEKDSTRAFVEPQTVSSDNGSEFEETRVPLIFDENQSISVLA